MASRDLIRVPVPPGPEGPARLLAPLAAALDGSGPAIAPVPTVSASISNEFVMTLLAAVKCDSSIPLESDDVALVIATSGSTGRPRGVLLTAGQLTALTPSIQGDSRPQWIAALPVTSMGGINVLVRALAAEREPVVVPSVGGAGPFTSALFASAVTQAAAQADDVRTSLVPAQLARLLSDDMGIEALQGCADVLVGGAATRDSLLAAARELGINVRTTYGATETAGGCIIDGRPLPGVTVTTSDPDGAIRVHGPNVALGYRADPEGTAARFADGGFRTDDIGEIAADGSLTVLGRSDDVIIVRGVNVSPFAVEGLVADLPNVRSAAAVAGVDRLGDPLVHVFVVARDEAPTLEDGIRDRVGDVLGTAARPQVHRVERLPHLPNGKVDRRELRHRAAGGGD